MSKGMQTVHSGLNSKLLYWWGDWAVEGFGWGCLVRPLRLNSLKFYVSPESLHTTPPPPEISTLVDSLLCSLPRLRQTRRAKHPIWHRGIASRNLVIF